MKKTLISSGSSFEEAIGYSRAVCVGPWIFVSGTTGFDYKTMRIQDDIVSQTAQCFKNIGEALQKAGATPSDIVRVKYIVPEAGEFEKCFPVLKKYFGEIRPAATMISAGLADTRMKIEIEVTALKTVNDIQVKRTTGRDRHFNSLAEQLNEYLNTVFGETQKTFDPMNTIGENDAVVVVFVGDTPAGCGCLRKFSDDIVEIKRMFVHPQFRKHGVAGTILKELEDWSHELNYGHIVLETNIALKEACNLYKKHGYSTTDKWGLYAGVESSMCMKKSLS